MDVPSLYCSDCSPVIENFQTSDAHCNNPSRNCIYSL